MTYVESFEFLGTKKGDRPSSSATDDPLPGIQVRTTHFMAQGY